MNRLCCAAFHTWTAFCLLAVLSLPVSAAQRVALVIGNAEYRHTTPLRNPRNDAADVGRAPSTTSASRSSKASTSTGARSDRCSANSRSRRAAPR